MRAGLTDFHMKWHSQFYWNAGAAPPPPPDAQPEFDSETGSPVIDSETGDPVFDNT